MNSIPGESTSAPSDDGVIGTLAKHLPSIKGELKWEPLVLTPEKVSYLWTQLQQFPIIFDDFNKDDPEAFVRKLTDPGNIFVDIGPGLGLAAGFAVRPHLDAVLHLVMFDRRLRGREPLFKEILTYYFSKLKLRRLTAMIAEDAATAIKLVQRLGFQEEGVLRQAMLRGGVYYDVRIFGLLREEL